MKLQTKSCPAQIIPTIPPVLGEGVFHSQLKLRKDSCESVHPSVHRRGHLTYIIHCIRATSCYVEGDFDELKNNILDGVHRRLRPDKFFIIHFGVLKGQSLIAAAAMATVRMSMAEENVKNIFVIEPQVISNQESKKKYLTHDEIDESELPTGFDHESKILAHSSSLNIENKLVVIPTESNHLSPTALDFEPDWDLHLTEN